MLNASSGFYLPRWREVLLFPSADGRNFEEIFEKQTSLDASVKLFLSCDTFESDLG